MQPQLIMSKDARNVKTETEESEVDIIFCVYVLNGRTIGGERESGRGRRSRRKFWMC